MAGSLITVARELSRYQILSVYRRLGGTKGHCKSRGLYLLLWIRNENHQLGAFILYTTE